MAEWTQPKTDWTATDRLNISDFNRIKNNIIYVYEQAALIFGEFAIQPMGEDMSSVLERWEASRFNAFEENVDVLNRHLLSQDYGFKRVFYDNGIFIDYAELNRLEKAIEGMKRVVDGRKAGMLRLAFRFGFQKGLYL